MAESTDVPPPKWTDKMFAAAEVLIGGKVSGPETGYLGLNDVVRGRPPQGRAKSQVTL